MDNKEDQNEDLEKFFDLSSDMMVIATGNGYFKRINQACSDLLGYTKEELLGQPILSFIHPDDRTRTHEEASRMRDDSVINEAFNNRYIKKNGDIIWIAWTITVKDKTTYAVGRDITQRKQLSDERKREQDQLNLALENAQMGTWCINLKTGGFSYSEITKKIYGAKKEVSNIYDFVEEFIHPDDQEKVNETWINAVTKHINYSNEFRVIKSNGEIRWVITMGKAQYDEDGRPTNMVGVVADITKRKTEEENLRMLATLVENSHEIISVFSLDFKTSFMNAAAKKLLGVENTVTSDLELVEQLDQEFQGMLYKEILPALREKSFWSGEVVMQNLITKEKIPVFYTLFPIVRSGSEEAFAYGSVARDIRVFKKNEQEQLQARKRLEALAIDLRNALEARDTFISIASHELKTPLTSLKLQSQLSKKLIEREGIASLNEEQIDRMVNTPLVQANRLIKLINDMLDISVINSGKLVIKRIPTNISVLVKDTLSSFSQHFVRANCTLTTDIEPDIIGEWDTYRLDQVVSNLITNAIKYAPGKPILVGLHKVGSEVIFSIKDQGPGIHKESQSKIFNRFERGVPASGVSGLGLGLYLAKQIVEGHGGEISVVSEPEQGSEFIVKLPLFKKGKTSTSQILAESKKNPEINFKL